MGATTAIGLVLALVVPICSAWAFGRSSIQLEQVSVRNVSALDIRLILIVAAATTVAAAAAEAMSASAIGLLVARAVVTFTGLTLVEWWRGGWDTAAVPPTLYFLAVAIAGRGEDIEHPATWAWIAADGHDGAAWVAAIGVLTVGLALAIRRIRAAE
jgi:hypothetical protein